MTNNRRGISSRYVQISRTFRNVLLAITFLLSGDVSEASGECRPHGVSSQKSVYAKCLPADVKADDVGSFGLQRETTVSNVLTRLKARCRGGKLIDRRKRQIRFFRRQCFGFPPPDYEAIRAEEALKLKELQAKFTVVQISCDPRIP